MRTFLRQRLSENGINTLPDSSGASSSSDIFRQLFGVPSGGMETNFVRQNRRMPTVVTLNDPNDSNLLSSQNSGSDNANDNNNVVPGNSNSASDISVVVVNRNQRLTDINDRNIVDENMSTNVETSITGSVSTSSESGILLPDSVIQTNTSSFPQMFGSPFSFPSSSASFWPSNSGPLSPTQPSVSDSNSAQGGSASSGFFSIFSGSPSSSFSSSTSSSNQQPFDTSAWNRFMTTTGSFNPTDSVSGMDRSNENTDVNVATNAENSQPVVLTNTVSTGPGVNLAGTTFSGESITTQEPAVSRCWPLRCPRSCL